MTHRFRATSAILVVEDDCLLRMLTADIVSEAGFVALQAANADEALAILSARSAVDVLLTGVVMAGSMDGIRLAHEAHKRRPLLKIIVASGGPGLSNARLPGGCRTLRKPYHAAAMISTIDSLIGADPDYSLKAPHFFSMPE